MITRRLKFAAIAVAAAWLALAPSTSQAQKKGGKDRIIREEIMASALVETDMFQVVRSLRPHFLDKPRGNRSLQGNSYTAPTALYVDDKKDVGLDALRTMSPKSVEEVRYLDPPASMERFGQAVNGGAVLVKLYKQKADSTKP
jgi:hypothetical protein